MNMLARAAGRLSAILACLTMAAAPCLAQTALVSPNPNYTSLKGAAAFTGEEWMDFRQSGVKVTLPVATVVGQAASAAPVITNPTGAEIVPCFQGSATKACTLSKINAIAPSVLRAVANRDGGLGGLASPNVSNGTTLNATFRSMHQTPSGVTVSDIAPCFSNWEWQQTGPVIGANNITVKAYLEYAGTSYPLTKGGVSTITVEPGATVCEDPAPISLLNATFYIRTYVAVTSGTFPFGRATIGGTDSNNYGSGGGDAASGTGALATASANMFGPSAIIGKPAAGVASVGFVGDSIAAGTGDVTVLSSNQGYIERGLSNSVPWISMTRSGYKFSYIGAYERALALHAPYISTVIFELGVNDLPSPAVLSTVQANALNAWGLYAARGISVLQTTITPLTVTSTDGFTTVANQTANATDSVRVAFNNWVRGGAPIVSGVAVAVGTSGALVAGQAGHPLTGYIEVADTIESARDSGKFSINPTARTFSDGATTVSGPLTSATANFTSADIGSSVYIPGAGAAGAALVTQIYQINSATSVQLSPSPSTAVSGAAVSMGGRTVDGLHGNVSGQIVMSAAISAAVTSGRIK